MARLAQADLPELAKLKFELLNKSGHLHFEYDTARFADVAGLARTEGVDQAAPRRVLRRRSAAGGLDPPKGMLLLGVQGCGKSLAAKAVAGGFGVPLVRLDFGTLYNKYHGETEKNLRDALASAEQLAPCVLWIDEIEKGLAAAGSSERRRRVAARAGLFPHLDGRAQVARVPGRHRQRRARPAAGAAAQGPLRRDLLRRPAGRRRARRDLPAAPGQARSGLGSAFSLDALADASRRASPVPRSNRPWSARCTPRTPTRAAWTRRALLDEIRATRPLSVLMAEQVNGPARVGPHPHRPRRLSRKWGQKMGSEEIFLWKISSDPIF